jgi:hypothetical protein
VVSIAYLADVVDYNFRAGDDAASAEFVADWQDEELALDHKKIIQDAGALRATCGV